MHTKIHVGLLLPPLLVRLAGAINLQRGMTTSSNNFDSANADSGVGDPISLLWQGLDVHSRGVQRKLRRARTRPVRCNASRRAQGHAARRSDPKMVLLGPFDTGTHLLLQTLRANYEGRLRLACGWDTIVVDKDRTSHCRLWKHGINISDSGKKQGGDPLYQVLERQGLLPSDVVVVMLVRNPLSSIVSWKHNPYDLGPCVGRFMADYGQPCTARGMMWKGAGQPDPSSKLAYFSTMDAYNRYMRMYQRIRSEGRVRAARLVTYEDLVFSPQEVVNDIAGTMGWPSHEAVHIYEHPAKSDGSPVGRELALSKLRSRDWLQSIPSEEARRTVCRGLDMSAFGNIIDNNYNSAEPSRPYSYDCDGYS